MNSEFFCDLGKLASMPDLDEHQKIGFEVECADVTLRIAGKHSGDTYGFQMIRTETVDDATGEPLICVVLEERKGSEDPKVEVVTCPWTVSKKGLTDLKKYVNALVDLAGGKSPAAWAEAASTVDTGLTARDWIVGTEGAQDPFSSMIFQKGSGDRLAQCNVDLYLEQFYTADEFIQTMMDSQRVKLYKAAKVCATSWLGIRDIRDDATVGGLFTLILYTALCESRFTPSQRLAAKNSLKKDRVQPLIKGPIADLVRVGLTSTQKAHVLAVASAVAASDARPRTVKKLAEDLNIHSAPGQKAIRVKLKQCLRAWITDERERYTNVVDVDARAERGGDSTIKESLFDQSPAAWDECADDDVTTLGTRVWWDWDSYGGTVFDPPSIGTWTGKPIFPRLLDGKVACVAEVRQSSHAFSKKYWGDL